MKVVVEKGTLLYHTYVLDREKKPKQSLGRRVINLFHIIGNIFENPVRYIMRNPDEPIYVEYRNVSPEEGKSYLAKRLKRERAWNNFTKYGYFAAAVLFYPVELLLPGPGPSAFFAVRGYGSHKASKRENLETILNKIGCREDRIFRDYEPNQALLQYAH